jgi:Divergent InlB B-repeat domain
MPFSTANVTATYRPQGETSSTLTVNSGTGDGSYLPGVVVNIAADTPPAATQVFDKWVGQTANIANTNLPNTTIRMPFSSVTVIATYKDQGAATPTLTVTGGTGEGSYLPGVVVNIAANAAPANQVFDKWVGQTANIANINMPNTTIRMPFYSVTVIATYKDQGAATFTLTVTSGTGAGTYSPGAVVNIAANAAPTNQVFDKWVGQTAHIANINMPNTVIVMPFTNTEITATYRDQEITLYSLLVNNGDGDGIYLPGVVVNIVADIAPANQVFDKWVGQTTYIANINLPNTTIRMPFSSVTVIATYKDQGAATYTLTVTSGTGAGTYSPGAVVNIAANAAPTDQVFDKWVGQTAHIANINMPNTIIQMPFSDIAVTATYKTQGSSTYTLTVTGGTGGGAYLPGTVIDIVANAAPSGQVFDKWVEQSNHVANINLSSTTINMPFFATTVIATYKAQDVYTYALTVTSGAGDGNYLPGTVVNISADVAPSGYVFDKWVGQTNHVANINQPNTTIIMPFSGTTIVAIYKIQGGASFALTVTNGTGDGNYLAGAVVNISANAPESGNVFDKWVGNTANIENINLPNTTIQMPFSATTVVAAYKSQGGASLLTVTKGTGGGTYLPGTVVNISADAPAQDYVFDKWAGDTTNITNINLPDTTIVMPYQAAAVTATYKAQGGTEYTLTVTNGTGGGTYPPGTVIGIAAYVPVATQVFDKWIGDTAYITNINLPNTTFVMPYHTAVVTATYKTQGGAVNTLTVTNGAGGGTYLPGTVVDIAADKAIAGSIFDRWIGNTANIENINLPNTTIVMPFLATEITAAYIDQGSTEYTLTVTGGTGGGTYPPGTMVDISANIPEAGKVFDKWVGDTANIANIFLPNTTIYTPFYAATVVAIYKTQGVTSYILTVNGGSGDGYYLPGTCINIVADAASAGQVFDKWTGQTAQVADIHQSETTLFMPFSAANVIATYRPQGEIPYTLTINSGTGDGAYLPGSVVSIIADTAPENQVFDKWVGQTAHIANINMSNTSICMPFSSVTVVATYKIHGATTYILTITSGTGGEAYLPDAVATGTGGEAYLPGAIVNIAANVAPANQVFDKWVGQTANVANINLPNTTIHMPSCLVTVIATYKAQSAATYTLTVTSGTGGGTYSPGSVVNIAATAAPSGQVFDQWAGQTAQVANINMPNTIIQMPFSGIAVIATYKTQGSTTYTLTVTGGTGGGAYLPGTVIDIVANAAQSGYVFDKWVEQSNHVANNNLSSTTINMPFSATTVIATYKAQGTTTYTLTVTGGAGGGNYLPGAVVNISADVALNGYPMFDKWVGQTDHVTNINLPNTTITMPFSYATVVATYEAIPPTPPCSLSISPYIPSVTGDAGTTTYNISNAYGYTNVSWTASVWQGGDWFTITSGASGTDSGTITCSFTANLSAAVARVAYIGIVPSDGLCQGHLGIMVTQNPLSASATLLWTNTDGAASVCTLDTPGNLMSSKIYGPFTGWTADNFHREAGSEGTAQMFWNHINGTASIQFMNDMGDVTSMEYGPEAGWTAVSYHLNSNGTAQMLWNHTDGTASVWTLNVRGNITNRILYGPYPDAGGIWIAKDYRQYSDGTANMLWVRTDSYTSVWTLNSSGNMTSRVRYGPFTDASDTYLWYAKSYLRNSDGTANMLWSRNGYASVWTLDRSGSMTSRIHYGPYLGWTPRNYDKIR